MCHVTALVRSHLYQDCVDRVNLKKEKCLLVFYKTMWKIIQCERVDEVRDTLQPLSSSSKSLVLWRCKTNHDIM